eukprot:315904_1
MTGLSFITFNICYFILYKKDCLHQEPYKRWKDSLGWIFQGQFAFEMIILWLTQCRKYAPRRCSLILSQIISSIYIVLNCLFAIYIFAFRDHCGWDARCIGIDSLWNALWCIIISLFVSKMLKTKPVHQFRAVDQSDTEQENSTDDENISKRQSDIL